MNKHIKITVKGKVQGVWYRDSTRREAIKLGIYGFVKNEPDGSVHIEAEGEPDKLEQLVQWCQSGPERAAVADVDVKHGEMIGFEEFVISY